MRDERALIEIEKEGELVSILARLIGESDYRRQVVARGKKVCAKYAGANNRILKHLETWLPDLN